MLQFNATFIIAVISFVIFIFIMNMVFYKPVLRIIEDREKYIQDNFDDANKSKEKANSILKNKEERMDETFKSAKEIINSKNISANKKAKEIISDAKLNFDNTIKNEKEKIKNLENSTDINNTVDEISDTIVKKLIGNI